MKKNKNYALLMSLFALTFGSVTALSSCGKVDEPSASESAAASESQSGDSVTSEADSSESESVEESESEAAVTTYKVEVVDAADEAVLESKTFNEGDVVAEFAPVEKEGYVFFGYYSDKECKNEYVFGSEISQDQKVYAYFGQIVKEEGLVYTPTKEGTYSVKADSTKLTGEVVIPESINGMPVNEVEANAFAGQDQVEAIVIGESAEYVEPNALAGLTNLKSLTVNYDNCFAEVLFGSLAAVPESLASLKIVSCHEEFDETVLKGFEKVEKLDFADENIKKVKLGVLVDFKNLKEVAVPFLGLTEDEAGYFGQYYGATKADMQSIVLGDCKVEKLTVAKGKVLGQRALDSINELREVVLPTELEEISYQAFQYLPKLNSVDFGESLKYIRMAVFMNCPELAEINLPDTVEVIEYNAFSSTAITTFNLPKSLRVFGYSESYDVYGSVCPKTVSSYTVSEGNEYFTAVDGVLYSKDMTEIVAYPLAKVVTSITLDASIKKVGACAFFGMDYLENVVIPVGVEVIGTGAFGGTGLKTLELPNTIKEVGKSAFSGCRSLTTVTLPSRLAEGNDTIIFDSMAFLGCSALTSINLPSYITSFPEWFLASCKALESVTIEGNVKSIGDYAFAATGFEEVSMTFADAASIGNSVFNNCGSLTTFNVSFAEGVTVYPTIGSLGDAIKPNIMVEDAATATKLKEAWDAYKDCIDTKIVEFVVNDGVLSIYNGTSVNVVIPDTVTKIEKSAFYGNKNIKSVVIPASVEVIDYNAFAKCDNLLTVEFASTEAVNVTLIDRNGAEVTKINGQFFSNTFATSLPTIIVQNSTIKKSVANTYANFIGYFNQVVVKADVVADYDAMTVTSVDGSTLVRYKGTDSSYAVGENVTEIAGYAFYSDKYLETIDLGNVECIGIYAFAYAKSLTEVVIPESTTEIVDNAFTSIESLESITFDNCAVAICSYAFNSCANVTSIDFGNSIVSIGSSAFSCIDGDGIESVTLPSSIEEIADCIFEDSIIGTIYCGFDSSAVDDYVDSAWIDNCDAEVIFADD